MLWLYKRVIFGDVGNKNIEKLTDIDKREYIIFIPIIIGVFWLGVYPESFSIEFKESVINLVSSINNRILN